jgi:hypothetical protein
LLVDDPERKDTLLIVTQDGSVIAANKEALAITNLIQWAEGMSAKESPKVPLYVAIRDRIAGFSLYEGDEGSFRLAFSPVAGTDWMLAQIERVAK